MPLPPPPVQSAVPAAQVFTQQRYMVRRKMIKFLGGAFHVYDLAQQQVYAYSKMKAFKLKEDIRLYTGEDMTTELLTIKARQIIDFGATYDVVDPRQGRKIGALRRKGLKSMLRDEWLILDPNDRELGLIQEDSTGLAIIRRLVDFASMFLPQKYIVTIQGVQVAEFKQNFNPFVYKLNVDLTGDRGQLFDRRLALAAAILMAAIEGKQS
ncbi:MAG: hypothetical protein QOF78_2123 [Phycisphaerales bacterium]|nr:hypothetical protein [Phycisphaerales bacterium]